MHRAVHVVLAFAANFWRPFAQVEFAGVTLCMARDPRSWAQGLGEVSSQETCLENIENVQDYL